MNADRAIGVCARTDGYMLSVCSRKGVPQFGPPIPNPPIFARNEYFRDFLLTKRAYIPGSGPPGVCQHDGLTGLQLVMNGERAALHSPFIATKMKKSRQMQLEYIIKEFLPNGGD
jgi:hypothetical protein